SLAALIALAARTPLPVLKGLFRAAAGAAFVLGIRRRVVVENLRAAFGTGLADERVRGLARECYLEFGRIAAEIAGADALLGEPDKFFRLSGAETLAAPRDGRGMIVLTAHLGNFLAAGYLLRKKGHPLTFLAKAMRNPEAGREIEKLYGRYGNRVVTIRGFRNDPAGGRKLFRSLREGETVIILNDQDAGPEGYRSTFFGLPTFIPSGPARYAVRTGAPIATGFATREGESIVVEIQAPIDHSRAATAEEAEAIILDEYTRRLEAKVREAPASYFWFHKKWKAVPEIRARYEGRVP
ncbi:MAG: lysophospholipid acyltransferase family protein, partial [Gemmatimonadota bacterium]